MNSLEGTNGTSGAGEPNPGTGDQGDQRVSNDMDALADRILAKLDPILDKKLQSIKDKRLGRVERDLDSIQKRLADTLVQKTGMAPEEAEEIASRLPIGQKASETASEPPVVGKQPTLTDVEKSILSEAGLPETDPDIVALNQRKFADPSHRIAEIAKIVARKNKPGDPAALATNPGEAVNHDLKSQYKSELGKLRPGDTNGYLELIKKYQRAGYDPTRP